MHSNEKDNEPIGTDVRRTSVLFRHADFMKLWTGETVSLFGTRMGDVAISFAAVIALKATPFQMGILAAAGIVPTLVLGLFAGVMVDRVRRRPILIGYRHRPLRCIGHDSSCRDVRCADDGTAMRRDARVLGTRSLL